MVSHCRAAGVGLTSDVRSMMCGESVFEWSQWSLRGRQDEMAPIELDADWNFDLPSAQLALIVFEHFISRNNEH